MPSGSEYLRCTYAVNSLAQLILTQLPEGALLKPDQGGLPMIYSQHWPAAGADSFGLQTAWLQPTILLTKLYNFIFKKRICTECQFRVI